MKILKITFILLLVLGCVALFYLVIQNKINPGSMTFEELGLIIWTIILSGLFAGVVACVMFLLFLAKEWKITSQKIQSEKRSILKIGVIVGIIIVSMVLIYALSGIFSFIGFFVR